MKTLPAFLTALCAGAMLAPASFAQSSVTVVDFGAFEEGGNPHTPFTGTIEAGDPAAVSLLQNNAQVAQADNPVVSIDLNGGATLSWTNVSAWNNEVNPLNPGENFFLNRQTDPLDTTFEITTANPDDLVTVDFVGGIGRTAAIVIENGATTIVPNSTDSLVWTNVATALTGGVIGELLPEDNTDATAEGNVGAIRVTITAVPEPASLALLGLGAVAMIGRRRR